MIFHNRTFGPAAVQRGQDVVNGLLLCNGLAAESRCLAAPGMLLPREHLTVVQNCSFEQFSRRLQELPPVVNLSINPVSRYQPADGWEVRRIWIASAFGAMLAGSQLTLDYLPLGASGSPGQTVRALVEWASLLFLLPLTGFVVGLLIAAVIALWRRHLRRVVSNILAVAAIPVCIIVVAKTPLFDPWLWYTIANKTHLEALAANSASSDGPEYAVIEVRDVSTGLAGASPNHFIALIYDESGAVGLEPSERPSVWRNRGIWPAFSSLPIPKGRRLYGHFFKVDDFE